jgi:dTDP-4-amino-4,6-dideoxygalactose transaminase
MLNKSSIHQLAIFGGCPLFSDYRSTSNLVRPDFDIFLSYSKLLYDVNDDPSNTSLVNLLEKRLASFHQTAFCISFCNGFWGLVLTMRCLALKGKTEIVMPSLTYRRMADIAAWAKLTPHFCEVDSETLAVSAAAIAPCLNNNTALILGVHPIINCCDVTGLVAFANEKKIPLLFDSVESVYESYQGVKIGSFGNAECFSMHASKLVNGFESGYVTTNDANLAAKLLRLRNDGIDSQDRGIYFGIDANLNEIHAAMALASLDDLDAQVEKNRHRYNLYKNSLSSIPGIQLQEFDETESCSFKNIVVQLLDDWPLSRSDTLTVLNEEHILARAYYSPPLHKKKYSYPVIAPELPLTDKLSERFVLLPCGHFVSDDDIESIIAMLRFLQTNASDISKQLRSL